MILEGPPGTDRPTIDQAITQVVTRCRDHWQSNLDAAVDGRDPEGIHQVRVGLRRFRSALTLFKAFIPEHQRTWLNSEAKWIAGQLGPVRDCDVLCADITRRIEAGETRSIDFTPLLQALRTTQNTAQKTAVTTLRGTRMRRFTARLDAWLTGRGWYVDSDTTPQVDVFAKDTLNKRLRKIRKTAATAATLTTSERHALRISVKKIRYGLDFMASVLPQKRVQRTTTVLKGLQDSLGHLNDLDVAARMIALADHHAPASEKRRTKKAGQALLAAYQRAATKAEPETTRLCRKLAKLPAL